MATRKTRANKDGSNATGPQPGATVTSVQLGNGTESADSVDGVDPEQFPIGHEVRVSEEDRRTLEVAVGPYNEALSKLGSADLDVAKAEMRRQERRANASNAEASYLAAMRAVAAKQGLVHGNWSYVGKTGVMKRQG